MMKYVVAYVTAGLTFFFVDLIWLGFVAKSFYRDQIGSLMLEKINIPVAILFYALYVIGVVIFAVSPALHNNSWRTAILFGALFGFFAYSTYDLTNLATLRGWPITLVVVDIAWGAFLTAASATVGFLVTRALVPAAGES